MVCQYGKVDFGLCFGYIPRLVLLIVAFITMIMIKARIINNENFLCRLMKAQALGDTASLEFMRGRRILEINPDHPIVKDLKVKS